MMSELLAGVYPSFRRAWRKLIIRDNTFADLMNTFQLKINVRFLKAFQFENLSREQQIKLDRKT